MLTLVTNYVKGLDLETEKAREVKAVKHMITDVLNENIITKQIAENCEIDVLINVGTDGLYFDTNNNGTVYMYHEITAIVLRGNYCEFDLLDYILIDDDFHDFAVKYQKDRGLAWDIVDIHVLLEYVAGVADLSKLYDAELFGGFAVCDLDKERFLINIAVEFYNSNWLNSKYMITDDLLKALYNYLGDDLYGEIDTKYSLDNIEVISNVFTDDELGLFYVDECDLLHGVNDRVAMYFDYESYGRDIRLEQCGDYIDCYYIGRIG